MKQSSEIPKPIQVSQQQLPLSCPMPGEKVYHAHPRVFLPIESKGTVVCPYCGLCYTMDTASQ